MFIRGYYNTTKWSSKHEESNNSINGPVIKIWKNGGWALNFCSLFFKILRGLLVASAHRLVDKDNGSINDEEINLDETQINELLGLDLFEGDIITDEPGSLQHDRNALQDLSYRWPDRLVSIEVEPEVAINVIGSIHQAIREFEEKSLLSFRVADDSIEDWIRIYNGSGCSSAIGRVGGRQNLSLDDNCHRMATILHEFTHALGFRHTQVKIRPECLIFHFSL